MEPNGRFYVRSGNAVHEAKGREFDRMISRRLNISWIDQPVIGMDESCIDPSAMRVFKERASDVGMISKDNLSATDGELLRRMGLMSEDSLTRGGILLFHPAPEDVIVGSFSKIGMFDGAEILYQDVVGGPLVTRLSRILDVLSAKYLVRPITYDGWVRVENDQYPRESLRECIVNALMHND